MRGEAGWTPPWDEREAYFESFPAARKWGTSRQKALRAAQSPIVTGPELEALKHHWDPEVEELASSREV